MPIDLDKAYVSEIDLFLAALAKQFPKSSKSQQEEINKFKVLNARRDQKPSREDA